MDGVRTTEDNDNAIKTTSGTRNLRLNKLTQTPYLLGWTGRRLRI